MVSSLTATVGPGSASRKEGVRGSRRFKSWRTGCACACVGAAPWNAAAFRAETAAASTISVTINQIQVLGSHNSYHVEPPPDILDAYIGVDPDAVDLAYTHAPLSTQ